MRPFFIWIVVGLFLACVIVAYVKKPPTSPPNPPVGPFRQRVHSKPVLRIGLHEADVPLIHRPHLR